MKNTATLIFYRPFKEASKNVKIIIGTVDPNEVIAELHNGSKVALQYHHFGRRAFIAGVYSEGREKLITTINEGETHYFKCQVTAVAFELTAQIKAVEYINAKSEIDALSFSGMKTLKNN